MRRSVLANLLLNSGITSPLQLSGLWGWWDMSDLTTMFTTSAGSTPVAADTDLVGRVVDKSGNTNNITVADANRPMYKTGVQNSRGAVLFGSGAAAKFLATTANVDNDDFSLVFVIKAPATITGGTAYGIATTFSAATTNGTRMYLNTSGVLETQTAPTTATFSGATPTISTPYVVGITVKNTSTRRTLFVNAVTPVTNDTAVTATDSVMRLGVQNINNTNNFWTGHFGEAMVYTPALSNANMVLAIAYLNGRWTAF
jgi:hypothetical protein